MESLIFDDSICLDVLKQVVSRLELEREKLLELVQQQPSVVAVMINVVPVSTKLAEDTLENALIIIAGSMTSVDPIVPTQTGEGVAETAQVSSIEQSQQLQQSQPQEQEQHQHQTTQGEGDGHIGGIVVPHDLARFIEIAESHAENNSDIRDLLRRFEKSFVPLDKELLRDAEEKVLVVSPTKRGK